MLLSTRVSDFLIFLEIEIRIISFTEEDLEILLLLLAKKVEDGIPICVVDLLEVMVKILLKADLKL